MPFELFLSYGEDLSYGEENASDCCGGWEKVIFKSIEIELFKGWRLVRGGLLDRLCWIVTHWRRSIIFLIRTKRWEGEQWD